jgi:hypothetical protein
MKTANSSFTFLRVGVASAIKTFTAVIFLWPTRKMRMKSLQFSSNYFAASIVASPIKPFTTVIFLKP